MSKTIVYEGELTKAYDNPAGYDLPNGAIEVEEYTKELLLCKMSTGVKLNIPEDMFGIIQPRSSSIKRGIQVITGIIDNDYIGELKISFLITKDSFNNFDSSKSIAQVVFHYQPSISLIQGLVSKPTTRGSKGFGSSDE